MSESAPPDPPTMSTRQTLTFLQKIFKTYGLEAKSKLGQNFLVDLNLLDLIVRAGEVGPKDAVLEVGTGTGSLTSRLADTAGWVVTVEIDQTLQPVAEQMCAGRFNISHVSGDCLERKSRLSSRMLEAWDAAVAKGFPTRKLIANLPYSIATPLISNLLVSDIPIERMVVMVQWEIAERLTASVSTKDYNALSILVQSLAHVEIVRKVLPGNFFPRPKVDSAIVLIKPDPAKRAKVGDPIRFRDFLRDLYTHRRKNLRGALVGSTHGTREKVDVDRKLMELGIEGTVRAEALDLEQHRRLCEAFG
jgi:16S rRNA (adenine1518-N6/adenine1519-N6)-dimethyltransferase